VGEGGQEVGNMFGSSSPAYEKQVARKHQRMFRLMQSTAGTRNFSFDTIPIAVSCGADLFVDVLKLHEL
jgi:hypothetical protein